MEPNEIFLSLLTALIGRVIRFNRLAGNSLIIYIDCEPGDESGLIIWFEPTWHMSSSSGVLIGSRQLQFSEDIDEEEERSQMALIGAPLNDIIGKPITTLEIAPRSNDLMLVVDNEYHIKTFVSDPTDDEIWHIRDKNRKLCLRMSPNGMTVDDETNKTHA